MHVVIRGGGSPVSAERWCLFTLWSCVATCRSICIAWRLQCETVLNSWNCRYCILVLFTYNVCPSSYICFGRRKIRPLAVVFWLWRFIFVFSTLWQSCNLLGRSDVSEELPHLQGILGDQDSIFFWNVCAHQFHSPIADPSYTRIHHKSCKFRYKYFVFPYSSYFRNRHKYWQCRRV
jgi:hypothetical protein